MQNNTKGGGVKSGANKEIGGMFQASRAASAYAANSARSGVVREAEHTGEGGAAPVDIAVAGFSARTDAPAQRPDVPRPAVPRPASAVRQAPLSRADELAERLAVILEAETILYNDAVAIAPKKTDVIVRGKIEELESLVAIEQQIILKAGRLEDERETVITELSEALGLDLSTVTLSKIKEALGERSYDRLEKCQSGLSNALGELKNTNDVNTQLIQNALDYVNFSVNLLAADQAGGLYSADGDDSGKGSTGRSVFDVKL